MPYPSSVQFFFFVFFPLQLCSSLKYKFLILCLRFLLKWRSGKFTFKYYYQYNWFSVIHLNCKGLVYKLYMLDVCLGSTGW